MKVKDFFRISICVKYFCVTILFFVGVFSLSAQELSAEVKVYSTDVGGTNRQVFTFLEGDLRDFVNGRKWTDFPYRSDERIKCSFTLVVKEVPAQNSFRGVLYVQSHRLIGKSGYLSPLLNIRDTEMEFDYTEHQPLLFDLAFMQNNLTSMIAYYAYMILGLDLDSRSLLGGTACFRNMELIAAGAESYGWKGWERRRNSDRNRSAFAVAFNNGGFREYRQMWFDYHLKGLDVIDHNGNPGSRQIIPSIHFLQAFHEKFPSNVLVRFFGDAKLEEMATLLSKESSLEKKKAYDLLMKLYPTRSAELQQLK